MITAEEKAKELVDRYINIAPTKLSDYSKIYLPTAKECAKIAVEEIIKSHVQDDLDYHLMIEGYFGDVLKEIEKL